MAKRKTFLIVGLVSAAVGSLIAIYLTQKAPNLPKLTKERVEKAQAAWEALNIRSYHLKVTVTTDEVIQHALTVHDGKVTEMLSNGKPATQSAWKYWTADGLFGFLSQELMMREQYPDRKIYLDASFHPEWHLPDHFRRHVFGGASHAEWVINEFTKLP